MKVLLVSPFSNPRCGEAEFGRIWARELRAVGVQIFEWDGYYPAVYDRGHRYMPADAHLYDLIHVNWGPANMGHYQPEHFPSGVPLSVFLCDVPPNSTCLLHDRADLLMSAEWYDGAEHIPHGIPTYEGPFGPVPTGVTIGTTGIRDDQGSTALQDALRLRRWGTNNVDPSVWLPTDEEIQRLSRSTFNACWYKETGRGISMAATFCLASRRPLLVSASSMFDYLRPWEHEIYFAPPDSSVQTQLDMVLYDVHRGIDRRPQSVLDELSWKNNAMKIKHLWEGIL